MIKKLRNDAKGFTLIELMIVIAIIGILAAIAIPQFAAYRTRSFNSSAISDIKNLATAQAAFFSDWQIFGKTTITGADASVLITGPAQVGTHQIAGTDAGAVVRTLDIGLGNNVSIYTLTDGTASAFNSVSKHLQGSAYYAIDSDSSATYHDQDPSVAGTILVIGDCIAAVAGADEFDGVAGPTTENWTAK